MIKKTSDSSDASGWQPRIVAFLCNWCSYAGADLAGMSRFAYPAAIKIVRLPCSGRVDPMFIIKSFEQGADLVLVSGCHPGDCHYTSGNYHARRKLLAFRELMTFLGIDPRRFKKRSDLSKKLEQYQTQERLAELPFQVDFKKGDCIIYKITDRDKAKFQEICGKRTSWCKL